MLDLFDNDFSVEVKEALKLLKKEKEKEVEEIKTMTIAKRGEIGKYRAEADLYNMMSFKCGEVSEKGKEYVKKYDASNALYNKTSKEFLENEDSQKKMHLLSKEIGEIVIILNKG